MPGISVSRIPIPFNGGGGFNAAAYWATRFPSALIGATYSGTRIDLSWTNNGDQDYDSVAIWGSIDNVTFTEYDTVAAGETSANITGLTQVTTYYFKVAYKKGSNYSAYTDVISDVTLATVMLDGNTVAWYQFNDLSNITKDGSELISAWKDKLGSGHDLLNAGADATKPLWTSGGVHFNLYNKELITDSFDFNEPYALYIVMKIADRFRLGQHFCDGLNVSSMVCCWDTTDTKKLQHYNGSLGLVTANTYTPDTYFTYIGGADGAHFTGRVGIDDAIVTGYSGKNDPDGIRFKSSGIYTEFVEFTIVEAIFRKVYDTGDDLANIQAYCEKKKL